MNINEIAKLAGVSRATVSRYLNAGYVSEEKRERIKQVIDETGYQPSVQAKMLRAKRTEFIGVIIPKIHSESVSRMVAGISQVLKKEGYQLLLANTDNDEKEEIAYLNSFRKNQVDGVILIGTILTKAHKKALQQMDVPVVILGQHLDGYSCVYYDDKNAAKDVTKLLLKETNQIAYIGVTHKDEAAGKSRREGFLAALNATQKETALLKEGEFSVESGYAFAKEILNERPDTQAIFCATDNIAIGAIKYIKESGKKIPEDVAIAGIGDSQVAMIVEPELTSVHFYYKTSGYEAAGMLLDIIRNEVDIHKEIKMGYQVIVRKSTK